MDAVTKIEPVRKTVEVARSAEEAFAYFVGRIDAWWPKDSHSRAVHERGDLPAEIVMEPREGGRVFERCGDGAELDWGRVTVLEPGRRLVFTWHLSRPAAEATEVEVRFESLGPSRTRVSLEHRGWEAWGETAQASRDTYASGWVLVFEKGYGALAA